MSTTWATWLVKVVNRLVDEKWRLVSDFESSDNLCRLSLGRHPLADGDWDAASPMVTVPLCRLSPRCHQLAAGARATASHLDATHLPTTTEMPPLHWSPSPCAASHLDATSSPPMPELPPLTSLLCSSPDILHSLRRDMAGFEGEVWDGAGEREREREEGRGIELGCCRCSRWLRTGEREEGHGVTLVSEGYYTSLSGLGQVLAGPYLICVWEVSNTRSYGIAFPKNVLVMLKYISTTRPLV
jgi:hypothetical protein